MTTFTKGQKICKTRGTSRYIRIGEEVTVASVDLPALGEHWITLEGHGNKEFLADDFDPVEDTPALLKPGQVWAATADPEETYRVIEVRDGDVWSENRYGSHVVLSASLFPNGRQLVTDATPAPIDPAKVKAGDTVKLTSPASVNKGTVKVPARIEGVVREVLPDGRIAVHGVQGFFFPSTLTDHQPAPEPKPEESDFHRGFRLGYDNGYTNGRIQASADDSGETSEDTPAPLDPSQKARVQIADWDDFQEFDVVVQMPSLEGGPFVVERHQPAPEPEPEWKPGTVYGADGQSERYWFSDDGSSDGAVFRNDVGDEYAPSELAHLELKSLVVIDPAEVDRDRLRVAMFSAYDRDSVPLSVREDSAIDAGLRFLGIEAS